MIKHCSILNLPSRDIRIWNTIPKEITEITQPESFQAAISKLPFTTPIHLNACKNPHSERHISVDVVTVALYLIYHRLVTKPHSCILVLMLSRLLPVSWQCHTVL